jgi:hypothetical protein
MWLPVNVEGLPSQGQGGCKILEIQYFLEVILKLMTENVGVRGTWSYV